MTPVRSPLPAADATLRSLERLGGVALLLGAAVATAFILVPWGGVGPLPGEEALGRAAPFTVRASRDLAVPDEEATARRREEAARSELRVFDHDLADVEEREARIRGAFELMRSEQARARPASPAPARRGGRADRPAPRTDPAVLQRTLAARRDEFASRLQLRVDDADFAALAEAGFSPEVEAALQKVVRDVEDGLVVESRTLLAADREAGIRVRDLRGGAVVRERIVDDLEGLRNLEEARGVARQAASGLSDLPPRLRTALGRVGAALVRPTLELSQAETERRREEAARRAAPVVVQVRRGDVLLAAGQRVERRDLEILRALREQDRLVDRASLRLGVGVLAGVSLVILWVAAAQLGGTLRPRKRGAVLLVGLYLAALGASALGLLLADQLHHPLQGRALETFALLAPAPVCAALAAMLLSPAAGVLLAVAIGAAGSLLGAPAVLVGLQVTLSAVAAALLLARVQRRGHVWRAGALVGLLQAGLVAATWLVAGQARLGSVPLELGAIAAAAFLAGALGLPALVLLTRPVLESVFGLASDLRLRDLANLNHPALKELIVQAPGTWHHSVVAGALAEAGARAAGADPLLARVGAYFHDMGKARDPAWFAENDPGRNAHASLPPVRSATLVKRHVEDGVEAARRWKLPRAVQDIVRQHHGTRLVSFFWSKEQASEGGAAPGGELDRAFRYDGPRPQTREAALVMIADACEASSRDLPDPTPEKLVALVRRRIAEVLDEGQLAECDLTLRELEAAAQAMAAELDAIRRARPAGSPSSGERPGPLQLVRP